MARETRYDGARLGRNCRKDARGNMVVPGSYVSRTGVFTYKRADGSSVRELRHPDDVFAPASIASLEGAAITDGHPPTFVTPSNAATYETGVVLNARRDGRFVAADLTFRRSTAIEKVERGDSVELSCGYSCDIVAERGTYDGEAYDQRQTNIVHNHVGVGPLGWGRAGRDVRLRMDASAMELATDMDVSTEDRRMSEQGAEIRRRVKAAEARLDALSRGQTTNASADTVQPTRADGTSALDPNDVNARIAAAERRLDAVSRGR